ncbi:hypothetical protein N7495_009032 [Penicillium taxi]|uniref:uncharacterized protein n=1 Tax=Penicillium taxi TaxID=168475 RepID=UPI002545819B|nr:uncharacterized protein N7495_009032 [Penicillium taxi]KAJ5888991.1 hypothetical protein N7495_009032 [Penicillium taxi]
MISNPQNRDVGWILEYVKNQRLAGPKDSNMETVEELSRILDKGQVLNVRGTPASGKTTLAGLLYDHYVEHKIPPTPDQRSGSYAEVISEKANRAGYDIAPQTLHRANIVVIIDNAQDSFSDHGLWLGLIKSQTMAHWGPRIALFSAYGSPTGGPESEYPYSPQGVIGSAQTISLIPSNQPFSARVGLFYKRDEFDDVLARVCSRIPILKLDSGACNYLFRVTSGHPGAFFRSQLIRGKGHISEGDIRVTLDSDNAAFKFLDKTPLRRSFVNQMKLTPAAAEILRKVLIEGSVERDLEKEGIKTCYQQGWLHTELVDYRSDNPPGQFPCAKFPTIEKLVAAILQQFSRHNLRTAACHFGVGAALRPIEAAYQDEFYRSAHAVLGYSADISSEWSPNGIGRIDFHFAAMKWGIEILREGDRLSEHCERFQPGGMYCDWIKKNHLVDWMIIDCRTSQGRAYQKPETKLWRAVFSNEFCELEVRDQHNTIVVDRTALML